MLVFFIGKTHPTTLLKLNEGIIKIQILNSSKVVNFYLR